MNINTFPGRFSHSRTSRFATALLSMLTWSIPAFCGEIHDAARNKEVVELLLANKANVNAKNNAGQTPLYWAVKEGDKSVVSLLRRHGGHE